jgi:anti-anti-sigma factor
MPTLEVDSEVRSLSDGTAARLVRVRGSVDTSTLNRLDETLSEVVAGPRPLVVLDLSELDYINSRGMANLVKHHDAATGAGGRLVLAALPGKIYATFETMGFDSTFLFEPEVESALSALTEKIPAAAARATSASFPFTFTCDACVAPLTAAVPGKYRCPRCHAPFEITGEGKVLYFPAREARSVEMSLPCSPSYVEAARAAAASVAKDVELSAIPAELLDRTIDESMGFFVGKSGEAGVPIRLFVAADNREFTVAFVVTDEALLITDNDQRDLTFRALKGIVDELDVVPLEPAGQLLKLVKRV